MKSAHISNLDKPISKLIIGSVCLSDARLDHAFELLDAFVAQGGNAIDMAHIYGGGSGHRAIGKWLQARGNRAQIVLFDKGCHPSGGRNRVTPEDLTEELNINLDRLQVSGVDIFTFHRDDPSQPVGPLAERMTQLREEGKVKAYGGSNWRHERIEELNSYASAHDLVGFSLDNPNLSLATANEPMWADAYTIDENGRKWHEETQFPLFAWSSQGGGFFAGRESDDVRRVYHNEENFRRKGRLEEMAREKGVEPVQLALAWTLNQPYPTWALVGPENEREVRSCVAGSEIELTGDEVRWLERGD